MTSESRLLRAIDLINMIYLGILPAIATFAVLVQYGLRLPMLLFIGGIVVVSVYLAVAASYSGPPQTIGWGLLMLLDGPLFAVLPQLGGGSFTGTAINSFLVDGIAIWCAIVILAVTTDRPTPDQRWATLLFAALGVGTLLWMLLPYLRETIFTNEIQVLWLSIGVVEAVIARYFLLRRDKVLRDTDKSAWYILLFLGLWFIAMVAGSITFESGVR